MILCLLPAARCRLVAWGFLVRAGVRCVQHLGTAAQAMFGVFTSWQKVALKLFKQLGKEEGLTCAEAELACTHRSMCMHGRSTRCGQRGGCAGAASAGRGRRLGSDLLL